MGETIHPFGQKIITVKGDFGGKELTLEYGRFGFLSDPALTYQGKPNKFFQRLVLNDAPVIGDVSFHPAFNG